MQNEARQNFVADIASRYGQRLRRFFVQRLRNRADAPDLAQEVFLRLMRVEHHETIRSPEAYLFTVASHVLHQHTLRQSATLTLIDLSAELAAFQTPSGDDPMARVDGQQRLQEVERALAELPPKMSTTLMLHRFGGVSIEEIAQQLGVSGAAARKYLARALTQCRDVLEKEEGN